MFKFFKFLFFFGFLVSSLFANSVSEQFYEGMSAFNQGKYKKSIKIFKKIIQRNSNYNDLGRIQEQIGISYEYLGRYKKAFEAYEQIFLNYIDYENLEGVVKREYDMAFKLYNDNIKPFPGNDGIDCNKTVLKIFKKVVAHFPFGPYAEDSMLKKIDIFIRIKRYDLLKKDITFFRKNYENSPFLDEVLFQEGYSYFIRRKKVNYDQTNTDLAITKFLEYLKLYPYGKFKNKVESYLVELQGVASEQQFKIAEFYVKNGNSKAACIYFSNIIKDFPDTIWAESAKKELALLS